MGVWLCSVKGIRFGSHYCMVSSVQTLRSPTPPSPLIATDIPAELKRELEPIRSQFRKASPPLHSRICSTMWRGLFISMEQDQAEEENITTATHLEMLPLNLFSIRHSTENFLCLRNRLAQQQTVLMSIWCSQINKTIWHFDMMLWSLLLCLLFLFFYQNYYTST